MKKSRTFLYIQVFQHKYSEWSIGFNENVFFIFIFVKCNFNNVFFFLFTVSYKLSHTSHQDTGRIN